jgi:hypothetical protein
VWTAPPLTSGFFVLAAFFHVAGLLVTLLTTLLTASLLALSRIASRRFSALAALLTGASTSATFLNSLIAFTIVCHICSSPFVDD